MWRGRVVVWATLVVTAAGCGLFRGASAPPGPPAIVGATQEGVASWYGPGFHGNRTANGEVYDQYDLTAAHPSLPLGTRAMITNLVNGRSVEVRINDRGPYVDGRIVDLSYAAARTIGMIGPGTSRVRLEVLRAGPVRVASRAAAAPPPPRPMPAHAAARRPPPALPRATFVVQVASFSDPRTADHLRQVISRRFPEAYVDRLETGDARYHRVRIGPFPARDTALARAEQVARLGWPAIIMEDGQ